MDYIWNFWEGDFTFQEYEEDKDKYVVFTCAKNEDEYIVEFVEHYLKLGFDKIFIADNNDENTLDTILQTYITNNTVQLLKIPHISKFQCHIYQHFMERGNYKWCAYFDCDEFLELSTIDNIKDILDSIKEDCIFFNWMIFGYNGKIFKTEGTVQERFKLPALPIGTLPENTYYKPIIKGGSKQGYFNSSHLPVFEDETLKYNIGGYYPCNIEDLKIHHPKAAFPLRYKIGYIKHYITKSYEEYLNKISRGYPDFATSETLKDDIKITKFSSENSFSIENIALPMYVDGVLSNTLKEAIKQCDVIVILNENNTFNKVNIYALAQFMLSESGNTLIFPFDSLDDNTAVELIEIAYRTNNKIYFAKSSDISDDIVKIFHKEHHHKNDYWYYITFYTQF